MKPGRSDSIWVGVRGFHAREKHKVPVRAIVEGDLFLSARSSFFLLLSFFFSHPESCLKIQIFCSKKRCFRRRGGEGRKNEEKGKKTEGNPSLLSAIAGVTVFIFLIGFTTDASWPCLKKKRHRWWCLETEGSVAPRFKWQLHTKTYHQLKSLENYSSASANRTRTVRKLKKYP